MRAGKGRMVTALVVCLLLCFLPYAYVGASEEEAAIKQEGQEGVPEPPVLEEPAVPMEDNTNNSKEERFVELTPKEPSQPEDEPWDALAPIQSREEGLEQKAEDVVSNEEELWAWLEGHSATGGTVFLDNEVRIMQHNHLNGISGEIIINTGSNGLVFDGGTLTGGDIKITGEGVEVPVVDVWQVGDGSAYSPSWNSSLLQMNITATGQEGRGGTALRISTVDAVSFDITNLSWQGEIRSYGEGAKGLWLAVPMEAWCYNVKVSGNNSMAVYAPMGADLYYCKFIAEGVGAVAVEGKDVTLDSCAASPTPTGVRSINRSAMVESFSRLYLPLQLNLDMGYSTDIDMLYTPNVFLTTQDGSTVTQVFAIDWDINKYYNINTSVLGKTIISGSVNSALYGLGVFDDVPITLTVEVRDPELPCISQIIVKEKDGNRYVDLNFWEGYDPTEESVILWRSDDKGETWQDATYANDIFWDIPFGDSVKFTYDVLDHPVWFQLEVVGVGESNIAILYEKDGVFVGGNGGDRTGTDREGVKPPSGGNGSEHGGSDQSGSTPNGGSSQPSKGDDEPKEEDEPKAEVQIPDVEEPSPNPLQEISADNDTEKNVNPAEANTKEVTEAFIPSELPPLSMEEEGIPVWKPITVFAQSPQREVKGEETPSEKQETVQEVPPKDGEETISPEENTPDLLAEQSSAKPKASAKALTIFFLCAAGACSAALLMLGLGKHGRWGRGK